jgi:hypothetical protein
MTARGGKPSILFKAGDMVSLKVNKKYRLPGETVRLPCRILHVQNDAFRLFCTVSILQRYHQSNNINQLKGFDLAIPTVPTNTEKLSISQAYTRIYNRPSIAELQPKGQKKKVAAAAKAKAIAKTKAKGKWKEGEQPAGKYLIISEDIELFVN